jgi:hypothetical protein
MKKVCRTLLGLAAVAALALSTTTTFAAAAKAADTCPQTAPWTKIDLASGTVVVEVPADSGQFVTISWGGAVGSTLSQVCVYNLPQCWQLQVCIKSGGGVKNQTPKVLYGTLTKDGDCLSSASAQAVSHISYAFEYIKDCVPEEGGGGDCLWCSPGYWRNHLDNWPAGFAPGDAYTTLAGATVTYLDVLCNPRIYGPTGDFNNVGDILSAAALGEDVCTDESRFTSHTCPLGGTAANPPCP